MSPQSSSPNWDSSTSSHPQASAPPPPAHGCGGGPHTRGGGGGGGGGGPKPTRGTTLWYSRYILYVFLFVSKHLNRIQLRNRWLEGGGA